MLDVRRSTHITKTDEVVTADNDRRCAWTSTIYSHASNNASEMWHARHMHAVVFMLLVHRDALLLQDVVHERLHRISQPGARRPTQHARPSAEPYNTHAP